jgi:hypothetical protein
LDVEYRKQRNQQLALKNNHEQMALDWASARRFNREKDGHHAGWPSEPSGGTHRPATYEG